jgi:phosphatidylglycerophosphate synthase
MRNKPWDARLAAWLVTPFASSTAVQPNHFTSLRLLIGVMGCWLFAFSDHINTAAFMIALSNFIDHMDGELARIGEKATRFGHLFDLVSDGIVTILLFVSIGYGLSSSVQMSNLLGGMLAGFSVAFIFHLRYLIEDTIGKVGTKQPSLAGLEAEDVLYLLPIVTMCEGLQLFLYAATIGAPVGAIIVYKQYRSVVQGFV